MQFLRWNLGGHICGPYAGNNLIITGVVFQIAPFLTFSLWYFVDWCLQVQEWSIELLPLEGVTQDPLKTLMYLGTANDDCKCCLLLIILYHLYFLHLFYNTNVVIGSNCVRDSIKTMKCIWLLLPFRYEGHGWRR